MATKVLKILSGLHQGAEVELTGQSLTLGRGPDCDLILDDRLLADVHLTLSSADGNGRLALHFHGPGHVGTRAVAAGEDAEIGDGEVVTLGATSLCTGPADGPWPEIVLPDWSAPAPPPQPTPAPPTSTPESAEEAPTDASPAEAGPPPAPETAPSTPAAVETPPDKAPSPRRRFTLAAVAVGVVAGLILMGVFMGLGGGGAEPASAIVRPPDPAEQLRELAAPYGIEVESQDGRLVLAGYIETAADREKLRAEALKAAPWVDFRVFAREQIQEAANAVLAGYGYPLKAEAGDGGVLNVDGWAPTEADWKRVLVRLRSDVPGVTRFEESVSYIDALNRAIAVQLERNGLTGVRLRLDKGVLECSGTVPAERRELWNTFLEEWPKQFSAVQRIEDKTLLVASNSTHQTEAGADVPEEEADPVLPARVVSVMLRPVRCFVTADGTTYFEGGRAGQGYVVQSIGPRSIVFEQAGPNPATYTIDLK